MAAASLQAVPGYASALLVRVESGSRRSNTPRHVGDIHEASALIERALAEGTADARLFLHASVIAAADGRPADAARWAGKARQLRFTLLPSELGCSRG